MTISIIILVILILIIVIKIMLIIGKDVAKNATFRYLETKQIEQDEILDLRVTYNLKMGEYVIKIVYKSEEDLEYRYSYAFEPIRIGLPLSFTGVVYSPDVYKDHSSVGVINSEIANDEDKLIPLHTELDEYWESIYEKMEYSILDYISDLIKK